VHKSLNVKQYLVKANVWAGCLSGGEGRRGGCGYVGVCVSGVLFSVGVCVCVFDLLIFSQKRCSERISCKG